MRKPIRIEDNGHAGYVHYIDAPIVETIDVRADCAVAADLDADGQVVGIEYLSFDLDVLASAKAFAASRDLEFPSALRCERLAAMTSLADIRKDRGPARP